MPLQLLDVNKIFAAGLLEQKRLYKFRTLDLLKPERVGMIFEGRLYCPSPFELNDPWDCKPRLRFKPLSRSDRRLFVEELKQLLMVDFPDDFQSQLSEEVPADLMRQPDLFLDENYYNSTRLREYCNRIEARALRTSASWHICSFSATYTHPLLWAHYADSHRGISIEFDASTVQDFGSAIPVEYFGNPPEIHFLNSKAIDWISMLRTKAECWSYEEEYRLLGKEPYREGEGAKIEKNIFRFPRERITGVFLGSQIDPSRRELVKHWLNNLSHEVRIMQAHCDKTFKLKFTQISDL